MDPRSTEQYVDRVTRTRQLRRRLGIGLMLLGVVVTLHGVWSLLASTTYLAQQPVESLPSALAAAETAVGAVVVLLGAVVRRAD